MKVGKAAADDPPINQIFIPERFDKVDSELPREVMVKFWMDKETYWKKLAKHLSSY